MTFLLYMVINLLTELIRINRMLQTSTGGLIIRHRQLVITGINAVLISNLKNQHHLFSCGVGVLSQQSRHEFQTI